jgi:hypothetical protein
VHAGCCIENAGVLPWVHHAQDAYSEATQTEDISGAIWIGKNIRAILRNPVRELRKDELAYQQALACKAGSAQLVGAGVGKADASDECGAKSQTRIFYCFLAFSSICKIWKQT